MGMAMSARTMTPETRRFPRMEGLRGAYCLDESKAVAERADRLELVAKDLADDEYPGCCLHCLQPIAAGASSSGV